MSTLQVYGATSHWAGAKEYWSEQLRPICTARSSSRTVAATCRAITPTPHGGWNRQLVLTPLKTTSLFCYDRAPYLVRVRNPFRCCCKRQVFSERRLVGRRPTLTNSGSPSPAQLEDSSSAPGCRSSTLTKSEHSSYCRPGSCCPSTLRPSDTTTRS